MGKTSSKRRDRLARIDTGTLDQSVLLDSRKSEIVGERVAGRDEFGALLDDSLSCSLVRSVDD
jgi:hypothetical protein